MELWIRSQNKDRIVKANAVMVTTFQELVAIHCYIDKDTSVWLGNYTTKERALEVLDEIQKLLMPISEYKQEIDNLTINYKNIDTAIYEMPKD